MFNTIWHLKFLSKKPEILPRLISDMFAVRVLGKNRLRTVDFSMTARCNSRCTMCSAKRLMATAKKRGLRELTVDEIDDTYRQAVELGAFHVNLTGGDPLCRDIGEITQIIHSFNKRKSLVSLVTNSKVLTRQMLVDFKSAGLDTLQISLESLDEWTHDRVRNSTGNWKECMRSISYAKELKLNIVLSMVLTSENFGDAGAMIEWAKHRGMFVLLNPISASGANQGRYDTGIQGLRNNYHALFKNGNCRADTCQNFVGWACPGGRERIYVDSTGSILTCPHVQISYGSVLEEPLADIYRRMLSVPWLRGIERDCRHVFSETFIDRVMKLTFTAKDLPISYKEVM